MRPTRLELEGFASFRAPTTVDFTDADLFVLSGPTGAGKTAIVDAMVFSLYGSIPRYDDTRLVAPAISQGKEQARVRLDFEVGDTAYTAVRVVSRTKTGATTREARLERIRSDGTTVTDTDGARELTARIEQLLGLRFEDFTRTVVLPQGAFQEFLHAKPGDRQELLVRLLDLSIYQEVGKRARDRASKLQDKSELLQQELSRLTASDPEVERTAQARVQRLQHVLDACDQAAPRLDELMEEGPQRRNELKEAQSARDRVAKIAIPTGVPELAERLRAAEQAITHATDTHGAAVEARDAAEEQRDALPAGELLEQGLKLLSQRADVEAKLAGARTAVEQADEAATAAAKTLDNARASEADRQRQLDASRQRHAAHALARDLQPGDDCPVCQRVVDQLPELADDDPIEAAEEALATARTAREQAERTDRDAQQALAASQSQMQQLDTRFGEINDELAELADRLELDTLDADVLRAWHGRVTSADKQVTETRKAEQDARAALQRAQKDLDQLQKQRQDALDALQQASTTVTDLEPPQPDTSDLLASWQQLEAWAADELPRREAAVAAAQAQLDQLLKEHREIVDDLVQQARDADVEVPDPKRPRDAVVTAKATAQGRLEQIRRDRDRAKDLNAEIRANTAAVATAKELGKLLDKRHFEQWLLNRGLRRLVIGATGILRDLTDGAYSLDLAEDNTFLVIDHRNADIPRPARTLSGGETFLASLALALSLANHVADLGATGPAKLDALFLDEGFGTLDPATLDTVASAIEELGASGRMVGLITHVADLAERLPVRFEVRKTPTTSTVTKVVA